ncbi:MAG: glycosyltransferase family 4 protein [Phycisphaerales bacterium]|nr:glycosyltransferase family 4 protein [Phycisphaerales bacterium]
MTQIRADALVLVFTAGMSLRDWVQSGLLPREWPLYRRLRDEYRQIVLVTHGGVEDLTLLPQWSQFTEDPTDQPPEVICNQSALDPVAYSGLLPRLVADRLNGCASAIIKTNQMHGGDVAARIAAELRSRGVRTGLLARGGYLWSRFVAGEHGTHSPQAADAAAGEGELCRAADVIVGTTQRMLDDLAWRYGLDPSRLHLVPNYVLADRNPVPVAQRDRNIVLYAGQLVQRKRVDVLIEAISLVQRDGNPDIVLEIIGDGPDEEALKAMARRLGAPVRFKRRIAHGELIARMSRCGLYVQASELEGHPKTVLEAMATGAPVVVADSPGLVEVVQIGATGLRVGCDPASFAHAITQLLSDDDWRDLLGFAAAKAARENYALDAVIPLERRAHDAAIASAGAGLNVANAPVRFDPQLLHASPEDAAGMFAKAITSFCRRCAGSGRAAFLAALTEQIGRSSAAGAQPRITAPAPRSN